MSEFQKWFDKTQIGYWKNGETHASIRLAWSAFLKMIDEIVADDEIIRNKNDLRQWITDEKNAIEGETNE